MIRTLYIVSRNNLSPSFWSEHLDLESVCILKTSQEYSLNFVISNCDPTAIVIDDYFMSEMDTDRMASKVSEIRGLGYSGPIFCTSPLFLAATGHITPSVATTECYSFGRALFSAIERSFGEDALDRTA